jgi:hypothetical protein
VKGCCTSGKTNGNRSGATSPNGEMHMSASSPTSCLLKSTSMVGTVISPLRSDQSSDSESSSDTELRHLENGGVSGNSLHSGGDGVVIQSNKVNRSSKCPPLTDTIIEFANACKLLFLSFNSST